MRQVKDGYRSMSVLLNVNADLLIYSITLAVALFTAGYLSTL